MRAHQTIFEGLLRGAGKALSFCGPICPSQRADAVRMLVRFGKSLGPELGLGASGLGFGVWVQVFGLRVRASGLQGSRAISVSERSGA